MNDYKFLDDDDFETPRAHYKLIRWHFLDCYYTYCRGKIHSRGTRSGNGVWVEGERELGYAYEELKYSYRLPIEKLMLEVLTLILDGGRSFEKAQFMNHSMGEINKVLKENELQTMLAELPEDERKEFEHDLRILKLLK